MPETDTSIPFPDVWELIESLIFWSVLLREIDLLIWVREGEAGHQHTKVFDAINIMAGISQVKP